MPPKKRAGYKRKLSALAGLDALQSYKVPKKATTKSLLEELSVDSSDYSDEIQLQLNQGFRFPQLSSYLQVDKAWLIHNRTLDDSFSAARKRLQKNPISNTAITSESNCCTGFVVFNRWDDVEQIAKEGLRPGNDPDTWLGQPEMGVTVNQCADLAVARAQSRLVGQGHHDQDGPNLFLVIVRWVRSRAYIVSPEAEYCRDRLEPQPGYACHVSTWSRIDALDPAKITLEQAFQMAQVYLFEFDEELELRPKPEHVIPHAVVQCRWNLTSSIADKLDPLGPAKGLILVIPNPTLESYTLPTSRTALLPTPPTIPLKARRGRGARTSRTDGHSSFPVQSQHRLSFKPSPVPLLSSSYPTSDRAQVKSHNRPNSVSLVSELSSPPRLANSDDTNSTSDHVSYPIKRFQTPEIISRLGHSTLFGSDTGTDNACLLIAVSQLVWGYPIPEHALTIEIYTYRKDPLILFDGILHPCLHIQRLVSHTSLHYELAGLKPHPSKALDPSGPPILVSISRNHEWILPRLNRNTALSLQCDPSPFGGYRGNYYRITLHEPKTRRTEMAQFCQALQDNNLAGVVPMSCDQSSILFIFPDSPFSRSIGLPPADSLDTNYLHAILLTPYSLAQYPYAKVRCSNSTESANCDKSPSPFLTAPPMSASSELLFGQRKQNHSSFTLDGKFKLPLDKLLATLPDGGKNLLGSALIAVLARQSTSRTDDQDVDQTPNTKDNLASSSRIPSRPNPPDHGSRSTPRLDPRLYRQPTMPEEPDWYALASTLISSAQRLEIEEQIRNESAMTAVAAVTTTTTASVVVTMTSPLRSEKPICDPASPVPESDHNLATTSTQLSPPSSPQDCQKSDLNDAIIIPTKTIPLDSSPTQNHPLSCSSPANLSSPLPETHTNSFDMDVETAENSFSKNPKLNTSDMEIDNSFDSHPSPLVFKSTGPNGSFDELTNNPSHNDKLALPNQTNSLHPTQTRNHSGMESDTVPVKQRKVLLTNFPNRVKKYPLLPSPENPISIHDKDDRRKVILRDPDFPNQSPELLVSVHHSDMNRPTNCLVHVKLDKSDLSTNHSISSSSSSRSGKIDHSSSKRSVSDKIYPSSSSRSSSSTTTSSSSSSSKPTLLGNRVRISTNPPNRLDTKLIKTSNSPDQVITTKLDESEEGEIVDDEIEEEMDDDGPGGADPGERLDHEDLVQISMNNSNYSLVSSEHSSSSSIQYSLVDEWPPRPNSDTHVRLHPRRQQLSTINRPRDRDERVGLGTNRLAQQMNDDSWIMKSRHSPVGSASVGHHHYQQQQHHHHRHSNQTSISKVSIRHADSTKYNSRYESGRSAHYTSSTETSDWDPDTSLDEDMRTIDYRHRPNRHGLNYPTTNHYPDDSRDTRRGTSMHTTNSIPESSSRYSEYDNHDRDEKDDHSSGTRGKKPYDISKQDIDYRHPTYSQISTSLRSSVAGTHGDSSASSGSESLPRYSFYHPRSSNIGAKPSHRNSTYSPRQASDSFKESRNLSPSYILTPKCSSTSSSSSSSLITNTKEPGSGSSLTRNRFANRVPDLSDQTPSSFNRRRTVFRQPPLLGHSSDEIPPNLMTVPTRPVLNPALPPTTTTTTNGGTRVWSLTHMFARTSYLLNQPRPFT